jgi:transcriptional regulator with XRE-family HTH domain
MTDYKAIRTELGLTQKDLGELLGIDPTQISKAENGHEVPAMYEYALKGLLAENASSEDTGPVVDVEAYENKIKELEAALAKQEAKPAPKAQTTEQPQPKRSRGLGRPKSAAPRD